jgi:hypothetical protein
MHFERHRVLRDEAMEDGQMVFASLRLRPRCANVTVPSRRSRRRVSDLDHAASVLMSSCGRLRRLCQNGEALQRFSYE